MALLLFLFNHFYQWFFPRPKAPALGRGKNVDIEADEIRFIVSYRY